MAADLHIHSAKGLTEEDFACFFSHTWGSKWFKMAGQCRDETQCQHWERIMDSPSVWVGEVSWLKAALTDDAETFVPDPVSQVHELIGENLPILDDELKAKLLAALGLDNKTRYSIAGAGDVGEWLDEHMGEPLFTVSW